MRRVLLTGASGFVGRNLARVMAGTGTHEVVALPRSVDLRERDAVRRAFEAAGAVDYIVHAADLGGDARWASAHAATQLLTNAGMALHVLEAWRDVHPAARLIGFSSLWAYPSAVVEAREEAYWDGRMLEATEHYGLAKKLLGVGIQAMRREHGLRGTMLVLGNVYGPGDSSSRVVPSLIRRLLARPEVLEVWGDGTETRDFVYIDDQITGILQHLDYDGELLNITTGVYYSIRDVVSILVRLTGFTGEVRYLGSGGVPVVSRRVSVAKAAAGTGWPRNTALRPLDQGLALTVQAFSQLSD